MISHESSNVIYLIQIMEEQKEKQLEQSPDGTPEQEEDDDDDMDNKFFHYKEIRNFENIPPNTIDDGCCETVGRQVEGMTFRFSVVLCPTQKRRKKLKSWDLWGPFFMVLIFGVFINNPFQFLLLFGIAFGGSVVVTFNTRTLGGNITFFESVSILGYCIFPLFIAGGVIKLLTVLNFAHVWIKLPLVIGGTIWGVISAKAFIAGNVPAKKRGVSLFPIVIFYSFMGLMVLYL